MRLRIEFAGFSFAILLLVLFISPWLRGLFFQPDLLPVLIALAVGLLLYALHAWNQQAFPWPVPASPVDFAVLILTVLYALSFFPAVDRYAALLGSLKMTGYAAAYLLAAQYVQQRPHGLSRLAWTIFITGLCIGLLGWVVAAGLFDFPGAVSRRGLMSTLQYPNSLAGLLIVTLGLGAGLWGHHKGLKRALAAFGIVFSLVTLLATYSRAGWLVYAVTAAALVLLAPAGSRWPFFALHGTAGGTALLLGLKLLPALRDEFTPRHLLLLLGGSALFATVDFLFEGISRWFNNLVTNEAVHKILKAGAVVGLLLLLAWGGLYTGESSPASAGQFIPPEVTSRLAQITGTETSYLTRLETSRDAWRLAVQRPLLGAGAGGWDALYHQIQERLYWMTEVHNHFMQTAVEVGLIGLAAFTFPWPFLAILVFRSRRRPEQPSPLLLWGMTAGLLGLVMHAAADFDLSLPALSLWVWALTGAIRGTVTPAANKEKPKKPSKAKARVKGAVPLWRQPAAAAVPVIVIALLLGYAAGRLQQAGRLGNLATIAHAQHHWEEALDNYTRAYRLNPWNGSYALDLAQTEIALDALDRGGDLAKARQHLDTAIKVQPYQLAIRDRASNLYLLLGDEEEALTQAAALAWLLPRHPPAHAPYVELLVARSQRLLMAGDEEAAAEPLRKLDETRDHLLAVQLAADRRRDPERTLDRRSNLPAELEYALGQAAFMQQDLPTALDHLKRLSLSKFDRADEARAWLAAAHAGLGDDKAAAKLTADMKAKDLTLYESLLDIINR